MAKLENDFILLDESVVMNGFRALMIGARLAGFIKNPVMLCLHKRPSESSSVETDVMLPIGKWYDIRIEDGKLLAKPDFDDNDPFAKKIESKVIGGYMNGASVWIEPIAASDDLALAVPGQYLPTLTEWGVLEASIVDIPNCRNALQIKNAAGSTKFMLSGSKDADADAIEYLKSLTKLSIKNNMDKKFICGKLGLDENTADGIVGEKLAAIILDANKLTAVAAENTALKASVIELKTAANQKAISDLVDGAIKDTKLMAGDKEKFMKLAAADFETTKELIEGMKPYQSIENRLTLGDHSNEEKTELSELMKLSGVQLYHDGKLERLKELSIEAFKLKFKDAYGIEFKG